MREAPALAVSVGAGARAEGPRKARAPVARKTTKPPSLIGRAFARPGVTIAGAVFAAVMTGIVANAVLFQKGRHPSPLFLPPSPAGAVAPHEAPTGAGTILPATTAAPATAGLPAISPDPPIPPVVAAAPHARRVAPVPATSARPPVRSHPDSIGALLNRTGEAHAKPVHPSQPAVAKASPAKPVAVAKKRIDAPGLSMKPPD